MRIRPSAFAALLLCAVMTVGCTDSASGGTPAEDYTSYVEPRIGTAHCRWFHFTPGALPFGMAKPAPATNAHLGNKSGWEATGYDFRDTTIEGFPCLHEFQIGGIVLMPTTGELITVPGAPDDTSGTGYRSRFSHGNETATAGYYSVLLDRYGIQAELTATRRVAFQRFTYPAGRANLLFDIGHRQGESGAVKDSYVRFTDDGHIEGWVITEPEYVKKYQNGAEIRMYFSAETDIPPTSFGTFIDEKQFPSESEVHAPGAGIFLTYDFREPASVTARVGLSYTSIGNARENLETEVSDLTFDRAREQAHDIWQEHLSRIAVETPVTGDKVKFYTGLYHAILGRGLASDCDGHYAAHDGSVSQVPLDGNGAPLYHMYNTDGDWGGQWNIAQVWALAYPEYFSDHVSTHLRTFEDSGWLGDGIACCRYVSGVGTNLMGAIICAAHQCGITGWDADLGYRAVLKNELDGEDRPLGAGKVDTKEFVKYGYVPHRDSGPWPDETWMFSVSHTLEASYSAWAAAQWAAERGDTTNYEKLMWLSDGWQRVYDPTVNFVRPKLADGTFIPDFEPMQVWRGFQEGNAWQYTFYVPQDPEGLIEKVGADVFTARLDSIFTVSRDKIFSGGTEVGAFAGLQTLYNHGNQPCLHISWLFNEAGRPSLTQKWVRAILDEFYGTEGIHGYGYGQDEDQGQLGAWYVISSLGIFDIKGLTAAEPSFALGAPLFDRVTIRLNPDYYPGGTFTIDAAGTHTSDSDDIASGNITTHPYAQSYTLNGTPLHTLRIPFNSVTAGGTLRVEMGDTPCDRY